MDLRAIVQQLEQSASVPRGPGDRFEGYSVIGVPFHSGHVLALRRFPASSVGPAYTSVWHRDPEGVWTFYSTVPPDLGCTRYFGVAVHRDVVAPISLNWLGPAQLLVAVQGQGRDKLTWTLSFTESAASRMMNRMVRWMPESWGRNRTLLRLMGAAAGWMFDAGRLNLTGRTPNGNVFFANPGQMWLVESSRAVVRGRDIGEPGPLPEQACLRDVRIPQRGMFAVTRAFLQTA